MTTKCAKWLAQLKKSLQSQIHLWLKTNKFELACRAGAQDPEVEEPHQNILSTSEATLFRFQALIQVEFEEIVEPKGLSSADLLLLVKKHGSYLKAAEVIGASEAFVRQNAQQKRKGKNYGKTH